LFFVFSLLFPFFTRLACLNCRIKELLGEKWTAGTPFEAARLAASVIPVFPDDQKAVQLKKLAAERSLSVTAVKEFFERLSSTQSDRTAFFFLAFNDADLTTKDDAEASKPEVGVTTTLTTDTPDSLSQLLETHQFSSTSSTQTSTAKITERLAETLEGVQHSHFFLKKDASQLLVNKPEPEKVTRPPPTNNLQGLIKRKKQSEN